MAIQKQHKLTWFSKIILCIICLSVIFLLFYGILGIYHITNTKKVIINDKLLIENGWGWHNPFTMTTLSDFPDSFDVLGKLELQMCDGEIYKCEYIIKSGIDRKWVILNKKSPIISIPVYSLNSYVLDKVGCMKAVDLFKPEVKTQIENFIQEWLIKNTQNKGIIIYGVRIYTPFKLVK